MHNVSVFCFHCDCGRYFETSSRQLTCSCGRILIVEWPVPTARLIEKVPATAKVADIREEKERIGRPRTDCPDCTAGWPCANCRRRESWRKAKAVSA